MPTVLIVEDDEAVAQALEDVLRDEGYGTLRAANGQEALDCLAGPVLPAVILLDLMMPVMNGAEFLKRRAEDKRLSHVPVIISSAQPDPSLRAEAHLAKPYSADVLLNTLRRVLSPRTLQSVG